MRPDFQTLERRERKGERERERRRERKKKERREGEREKGEVIPSKNEPLCSFSWVVSGGGCQGEVYPPKMSHGARFWGWWVVMVARERSTSQKRAEAHIFGGCGWWWWPKIGHTTENECLSSFLGVVVKERS